MMTEMNFGGCVAGRRLEALIRSSSTRARTHSPGHAGGPSGVRAEKVNGMERV